MVDQRSMKQNGQLLETQLYDFEKEGKKVQGGYKCQAESRTDTGLERFRFQCLCTTHPT